MHQVVLSIVAEGCHFQGIVLGPGSGQGKGPEDPARIDEWYRETKLGLVPIHSRSHPTTAAERLGHLVQ